MDCYNCSNQQQIIVAFLATIRSLAAGVISQQFSFKPFQYLRSYAHCCVSHRSILVLLQISKYAALPSTKASFDKTFALIYKQIELSFRQPNVGTGLFRSYSTVVIAQATDFWLSTRVDNLVLALIVHNNHQVK